MDFHILHASSTRGIMFCNTGGDIMFSALSNSELLIMQYLWQQNIPQTFSQIKEYFVETGWKKQTINTFLIRLIQKGYLESDHSQSKTHYKVLISADEYYHAYTHQILNESFHGSLTNFISAFTGNQTISASEKEELIDFLKGL